MATETFFVTGTAGLCTDNAQVTVTVNPSPTIDAGLDQTICIGDTVQLGASGGLFYLWAPADSLSATTTADPFAWPTDSTQYIVTGTDANGCSSSDTVNVFVNPLPAVDAGPASSICLGDTAQLDASGANSYNWSPSGSLSNAAISNPLAFPTVNTTYTVVATDTNGCVNTDSVVVTINSLPTASVSSDTTICIGDTASPVASGGTTYQWSPDSTLSNAFIAAPNAFPTLSATYQVIISDPNGCNDTAEVTVTVQNLPTISAGVDQTICVNDTTQLNASGGVTYVWTCLLYTSPSPRD